METLTVFFDQRLVGFLSMDSKRRFSFSYSREWQDSPDAFQISIYHKTPTRIGADMTLFTIDHEKCDKDGICALECPAHIIEMTDNGPVPSDDAEEICLKKRCALPAVPPPAAPPPTVTPPWPTWNWPCPGSAWGPAGPDMSIMRPASGRPLPDFYPFLTTIPAKGL